MKKTNIVVMGGGTGTSVLLEGLKAYPFNLSAIITTADDGGSSGSLRKQYGILPPGDVRQCLVALASDNFGYFNERFQRGFLQGHTLGNVLITLFCEKNKNFQEAIDEILRITKTRGSLIPATLQPATLMAKLNNGRLIKGESNIAPRRDIATKLKKLYLHPASLKANPRAILAIRKADMIVVGPGNFYSSIIPIFLIPEISFAFRHAKAKKVYVTNLVTQPGHTDDFLVDDFIKILARYIGKDVFTHILFNNRKIPQKILDKYANESVGKIVAASNQLQKERRFIKAAVACSSVKKIIAADPLANRRNPFLHDPTKVSRALARLL